MRTVLLLTTALSRGGLPALPAGYTFIIDSDGVYLTDADGTFYIEAL